VTAGLAVAASTTALAVAVPATAALASGAPARHARAAQDPPITILTSGDRTGSTNGNSTGANAALNATGGAVTGTNGVTYRVFSGSTATGTPVDSCTTGDGFPAGQCTVNVPSTGTYTIQQYSAPTGSSTPQNNYFINPALGVGTVTPPNITAAPYSTLTVPVTSTAGLTVPMGSTATNSTTVRSGRWAVSRYNAAPPATCTRSVALLFDLSASITNQYLADYKAAATAYVQSLAGSSTNVTMYTFGTTAPVTGTNSPVNPYGPRNTNNPADVQALLNWIRDLTRPSGQYTNWDRGMWQMTTTFRGVAASQHYNEAIVLTDGDPTAMSANGTPDNTGGGVTRFRAVEAGIFSANALKRDGTRVVAVGLEAHPTSGSVDNLKAISGPTAGSLATPDQPADFYVVPFDELKTLLEEKALADCARLTIHKEANPGPGTFDRVGQVIHYTYTVRNDSPADGFRLTNITVHDNKVTVTHCNDTTLAVGQVTTCYATYTITQADLDRGEVRNAATATGETPNGHEVESPPDEEDITGLQHPDIHVTKIADPTVYTEGTPITYHYTVKNTGDVTLHNVTVTDDRFGPIHCTPTTLIPGQSGTCIDVRHTATAGDVEDASIENTAEAAGTTETDRRVTCKAVEVVTARITPAIRVTKTASPPTYTLGTEITYGYTVTNIGDVTLRNVHVIDSRLGVIACTPTILAPTASATCLAGHHTATQADVDAGSIHNTVTATGTGPGGSTPKNEAEQTVYATHAPGIKVTKEVSPETYTEGTPITYKYTVENIGNVTLHDIHVTDDPLGPVTCPLTSLAPGQSMTCTDKTHTATTADVAAKHIHNEVTATGTPPIGRPVTNKDEETVIADGTPGIDVTKSVSAGTYTEGTPLAYSYTVKNTGDVTLTDLTVVDSVFGPITCTPTVLAPGGSATCTDVTHDATAADVAAGDIHNEVTATGTAPDGTTVDDAAERTVFAETTPAIRVTKTATPDTYTEGTGITYHYTVTNTGDVTLTDLTVIDDRFGAITCTPAALAPGAAATCTDVSHTATAADVAAGSIHNNVSATGTAPDGEKVTGEAEQTVFPTIAPAIEVTKTASPREFTRPGEVITYTYVVTNAGDVTLHDVNLTDSTFGAITCPLTVLAPGESMHCVHTHTTTQADVDAGTISNAATAFGTAPDGQIVRDDPPETIHAGSGAAIEITKSARPTVYSRHGELITYTYTVTNDGNVTLRNVTLQDTRFGAITCPRTVLAPGETMTCTHTHAISAVDLDSGSIFNSAAATAHPPTGNPVDSEPENATVRGVVAPAPPVVPVTG
jgi:uncharacterized membrane protein